MSYFTVPDPPGWQTWRSTSANPGRLQVTITDNSAPKFLHADNTRETA